VRAPLLVTMTFALALVGLTPPQPGPVPPLADSFAQQIMARHACWTSGEPALSEIPGHVVATSPRDLACPVYGGPPLVRLALQQVAHDRPDLGWGPGVDRGLVVYAFCR